MSENEKSKKDYVKTLRALVLSRPMKTTLPDLLKDYKDMEGENFPFRRMGCNSFEEFLMSSNEFTFHKDNFLGTYVKAIEKQETAHLTRMIAAQKKPKQKKKRGGAASGPTRGAHHRFNAAHTLHRSTSAGNRPSGTQQRLHSSNPQGYRWEPSYPKVVRLPSLIPIGLEGKSTGAIPKIPIERRDSPPRSQAKIERRVSPPRVSPPRSQAKSLSSRLIRQTSAPVPTVTRSPSPPPPMQRPTNNYANSGYIICKTPTERIISQNPPDDYVEPAVSMSVTPEPEEIVLNKDTKDSIKDLNRFCQITHKPPPKYTYSCVTFKGGDRMWQCRVTISNKTYCSYPEHCKTMDDAQHNAALIAIGRLIVDEEIKKYPVCREDDVTIAGKLIEILKDYPNGVIQSALPEYFRNKFGLSLPENWINILYKYDEFSVEEMCGRHIVYSTISDRPTSDLMCDIEIKEYETVKLPWQLDQWMIQITNPVSTTEIYGRLVGEEYSRRFNDLLIDIEMSMITQMAPQVPCEDVQEGRIYLVTHNTIWYRVRVVVVDRKNARHHCFCIDTGEQDVYSELYECKPEYLKLPHQAICFSLAFLESFDGNPYVKQHLDAIFLRSPRPNFLARVITKQEEFEQHSSADGDLPIKVVLVNTDCPNLENNVNQIILQKICNETPAPQLESSALTLVKITHVSHNGDVFCQVKNIGLSYIQRLMDAVVSDQMKMQIRRGIDGNDTNARYLIRDKTTNTWYRATPECPVRVMDATHKMFCIDYGFVFDVANEDIYQLEPLNQALCRFPALAIKCRLHGLQNITPSIVSRIKGLLSDDSERIMKVMVSTSTVPQVNCYLRHQSGTVFCINESIKIEEELVRQTELKNNSPAGSSSNSSPDIETFSRVRMNKSAAKNVRPTSHMEKIADYEVPPPEETFTLSVVHISNPSYFVSHPCDDTINVSFRELIVQLQKYCNANNDKPLAPDQLEIGQAYAVKKGEVWQRCILNQKIGQQQVQVTLCDYAECLVVHTNDMKILPSEFRKLPKQGIRCSLYGIKPTNGDWSTDDIIRFRNLTSDTEKKFYSIVKNVTKKSADGERIVELVLLDKNSQKDAIFNNIFIKEHRALHI